MRGFTLIALLTLGAACQRSPRTLVIAYPLGPESLEANAAQEEFARSVLKNVYEPLVEIDANLALRPGLAESWYNPDELTWIFRLRRGVRLHDGRPLDASMVAAGFEKARRLSQPEGELSRVEEITALDPHTVQFRTRTPQAALLGRVTSVLVAVPPSRTGDVEVGTGPYRVRSWTPGVSTVLEAFPEYRGRRPPIGIVECQIVPDARERARRLLQGRTHLIVDVAPDEAPSLERAEGLRMVSHLGLRMILLVMDVGCKTGQNPFRDLRVRRAVALALDADALVRDALKGHGEPINQPATPDEFGYDENLPRRLPDRAEARRLLAAAGYASGFSAPLDYMPGKYLAIESVVSALTAQLLEVGIRLEPRPSAPEAFLKRVQSQDVALYLMGWLNDTGSAEITYESLLHTPRSGLGVDNGGGYSNPEMDRLIEDASGNFEPAVRVVLLKRAAAIVFEDIPLIPLYRQMDLYAHSRKLSFEPRRDRQIRFADLRWN